MGKKKPQVVVRCGTLNGSDEPCDYTLAVFELRDLRSTSHYVSGPDVVEQWTLRHDFTKGNEEWRDFLSYSDDLLGTERLAAYPPATHPRPAGGLTRTARDRWRSDCPRCHRSLEGISSSKLFRGIDRAWRDRTRKGRGVFHLGAPVPEEQLASDDANGRKARALRDAKRGRAA